MDAAKLSLRDRVATTRRRRSLTEITSAAAGLREVLLAAPEIARAATVAAYISVGTEPGTGPLIDALRERGKRVIVPRLQPDNDLDWSVFDGPVVSAARGLLEPTTPLLGPEAIATADVVLVPGLAADRHGNRLGRGGGSYDRALVRVPVGTFTCVLLYADELIDAVPHAPHDRTVTAAATPLVLTRFGA